MSQQYTPEQEELLRKAVAKLAAGGDLILEGESRQFRLIMESEMDYLTHGLEDAGYKIWFTCEVDGVEYRLAAPRE